MIVSVAVLTIRKGTEREFLEILNDYITKEKKVPGCVRVYSKRAMNNDDTYLIYTEYENRKALEESEKISAETQKAEGGNIEFKLRPFLLKGFYGDFE
jgi:quinol monooxygenase YgiN